MVEGVVNPAGPPTARPLVSVIIPAHNAAEYLRETVGSALDQTYQPLEVIVVNDGSTDDTRAIAMELGAKILYVEQANAGPAAARNTALRVASGDLIALLDADDRWKPTRLERCVDILLARPEIGMVTTDANLIEHGVATDKRSYGDRRRFPFPGDEDEQIAEIARRNFLFVGVVFRRELIERCGNFDERTWGAEDYELWTRFLLSGSRAAFVNEPLGWYRLSEGSLSSGARQWAEHLYVLEKHLPALWKQGARGRASDIYDIGEKRAAAGDRKGAAQFFRHAVTGEGASFARRVKLAAGGLVHLARGARPGSETPGPAAGPQVQPAEPTRG